MSNTVDIEFRHRGEGSCGGYIDMVSLNNMSCGPLKTAMNTSESAWNTAKANLVGPQSDRD